MDYIRVHKAAGKTLQSGLHARSTIYESTFHGGHVDYPESRIPFVLNLKLWRVRKHLPNFS
jgi:hypothetical protein